MGLVGLKPDECTARAELAKMPPEQYATLWNQLAPCISATRLTYDVPDETAEMLLDRLVHRVWTVLSERIYRPFEEIRGMLDAWGKIAEDSKSATSAPAAIDTRTATETGGHVCEAQIELTVLRTAVEEAITQLDLDPVVSKHHARAGDILHDGLLSAALSAAGPVAAPADEGLGTDQGYALCPLCKGTGSGPFGPDTCGRCAGEGQVIACPTCRRPYEYHDEGSPYWPDCDGKASAADATPDTRRRDIEYEHGWNDAVKESERRRDLCVYCKGTGWVVDENWQPEFPDEQRQHENGFIRCGGCQTGDDVTVDDDEESGFDQGFGERVPGCDELVGGWPCVLPKGHASGHRARTARDRESANDIDRALVLKVAIVDLLLPFYGTGGTSGRFNGLWLTPEQIANKIASEIDPKLLWGRASPSAGAEATSLLLRYTRCYDHADNACSDWCDLCQQGQAWAEDYAMWAATVSNSHAEGSDV